MSAQARSNSGVRDLRAMFENKGDSTNESSSDRGRSPSGASQSRSPSARKIRSSFVSVEPSGTMEGISERRESFSGSKAQNDSNTQEAKVSMIDELKQRQSRGRSTEAVPENAVETPGMPIPDKPQPMDNPDKPVSAAQDEDVVMKPAEPTSKAAVSGGGALKKKPSGMLDKGKSNTNGNATKAKPAAISTSSKPSGPSAKAASSKSSPNTPTAASKPAASKAPRQSTVSNASRPARPSAGSSNTTSPPQKSKPRSPTRPVNLPSHLTKPTAASAAKHEPDQKDQKAGAKDGPRAPTKPVNLPSRLTAPTASYQAKHEEEKMGKPAPKSSSSARTSMASAGSKPRASLAPSSRPPRQSDVHSKDAQQDKKPSAPPSEGFLARMMKPTTASANHTAAKHEEPEKPKTTAPPRTSNATDKTSKPAAKPAQKAADTSKKPPRPSMGPAKKEEPNTAQKVQGKVAEKVEQAKDAVQDKLKASKGTEQKPTNEKANAASATNGEPSKPEQAAQAKEEPTASGSAAAEQPSREQEAAAGAVSSMPSDTSTPSTKAEPAQATSANDTVQIANSEQPAVAPSAPQEKTTEAPKENASVIAANSEQPAVAPSTQQSTPAKLTSAASNAPTPDTKKADTTPAPESNAASAFRNDGAAPSEPVALTDKDAKSSKPDVPAATTSDESVTKPQVEQKMDPMALTSQKADEKTKTEEPKSPGGLDSKYASTPTKNEQKLTSTPAPDDKKPSDDDREAEELRRMINDAISKPDAPVSATEQAGKEQAIEEKRLAQEATPEPEKEGKAEKNAAQSLEATPAALEKNGDGEIR